MRDGPAISDEADPLYRPLDDLTAWATAPVDTEAWTAAVQQVEELRAAGHDRLALAVRGALLAAAHQSGATDGLYRPDPDLLGALVRGDASLPDVDDRARDHVRAGFEALELARDSFVGRVPGVTEASVRRIHEVACRPQLTHPVWVGDERRDHVMAGGDYKHHANHVRTAGGDWRPSAPVALVRPEMARIIEAASGRAFSALHPVTQARYLHDALLHVQPFADGNGRVARALASGPLLRAFSLPLLRAADEPFERAALALADRCAASAAADVLGRWRAQAEAGRALAARLLVAVPRAIERHDRSWGADLSGATVAAGDGRVTVAAGPVVEVLAVDAHPLDGGPVAATAREARLRHEGGEDGLDQWLDRVVSTLGLRLAAAAD